MIRKIQCFDDISSMWKVKKKRIMLNMVTAPPCGVFGH